MRGQRGLKRIKFKVDRFLSKLASGVFQRCLIRKCTSFWKIFSLTGVILGAKGAENDQNSKLTDFSQNWCLGYFIGAEFEYAFIFGNFLVLVG